MKYSKLFGKTVKQEKRGITAISHKLLYKAGFIRESTAGRYYFLPLGMRVHDKIVKIVEEEMDKIGAQKMVSPVLHPLELWKETNRTNSVGFELTVVKDRRGSEFALGGTAEEMFVDVVRDFNLSYKDLPFTLYQFSTKFRDELRAKGGLLRMREFVMKDAYSFSADDEQFMEEYKNMSDSYKLIFERCGLKTYKVLADNGYIGGDFCHEFDVESDSGESLFYVNHSSTISEHEDIAKFYKEPKNLDEEIKSLQEVEAKRGRTMEDGVKFHGLPLWKQLKDVVYKDEKGRFILALIRGDYNVNEIKLKKVTGSLLLESASDNEIREKLGSEPGFISPVGIRDVIQSDVDLVIVADDSLRTVNNFYGGANKNNSDYLNMNIDRDFDPDFVDDIALVYDGALDIEHKQKLTQKQGIEVGNIFQLGYHYSKLMKGANFVDMDGQAHKYYMGCYGIGIARIMASVVETHNDSKGIIWPESIAPYKYYLIDIISKTEDKSVSKLALQVYEKLGEDDVLWDDRSNVSNGEKFADADLIGCPIRIVVSEKSIKNGGIEITYRKDGKTEVKSVEELASTMKA